MDNRIVVYDDDTSGTLQVRRSIRDALRKIHIPGESIERVLAFYAGDIQQIVVPPPSLPPRMGISELASTQTLSIESSLASDALNTPSSRPSRSLSQQLFRLGVIEQLNITPYHDVGNS